MTFAILTIMMFIGIYLFLVLTQEQRIKGWFKKLSPGIDNGFRDFCATITIILTTALLGSITIDIFKWIKHAIN